MVLDETFKKTNTGAEEMEQPLLSLMPIRDYSPPSLAEGSGLQGEGLSPDLMSVLLFHDDEAEEEDMDDDENFDDMDDDFDDDFDDEFDDDEDEDYDDEDEDFDYEEDVDYDDFDD